MRIFIVSKYGSSKDLALKLQKEGHDVLMYITNQTARRINPHKFVVDKPSSDMMHTELFLIEDDTAGLFADKARQLGRPVIGGGTTNDRLIHNSLFMEKTLTGCGLQMALPETRGVPVNLGGWFCGEEFIRPYFLGLRYTRVGAGDVGKHTKGMGIVGQYRQKGNIFNLLRKLETILKTVHYQGFVNMQLYINNESAKVVGMELSLSFPTTSLISSLHNTMGNFLYKVAIGMAKQATVQPDRIGVGVVWLPNMDEASISPIMICGTGNTIKDSTSIVYKEINKLKNEDAYYRIDIGSNYLDSMSHLKKWDWI